MPICPSCKKDSLIYVPWLGQMWKCRKCEYQGPIVIEMSERALQSSLRKIPKGKVTTYKILAEKLGVHQRAVAGMLKRNDPKAAPCYKVVASDGKVGGYSGPGGVKKKIKLLRADGVEIEKGKIDLKKFLFEF